GMVIGQREHAGTEHDALGPRRGAGNEEIGRAVNLEAAGMMLADPGLGEAELLQILDQPEIALHQERRVLVGRGKGRQEDAGPQIPGWIHGSPRAVIFLDLASPPAIIKEARASTTRETLGATAAAL